MRRKPAILLFLLLLLSIGGAVFYQQLQQARPPSFSEIDAFLKHEAASGDWHFASQASKPPYQHPRAGWWDYLLIRRSDQFQVEEYRFIHAAGEHIGIATVLRKNGTVQNLYLNNAYRVPPGTRAATAWEEIAAIQERAKVRLQELEKSIYGRFPGFRPSIVVHP